MYLFTVSCDSKNLGSLRPEDCGQILITYSDQSQDCVCQCLSAVFKLLHAVLSKLEIHCCLLFNQLH